MARPGKTQLNAFLTNESYEAWRDFCAEQGCTMTALIEAIGRHLPTATLRSGGIISDAIRDARRIDSERRRK